MYAGSGNQATASAVMIEAPYHVRLCDEVPMPQPGADEVRVRLEGCGVCASNLGVWHGAPWFSYPLASGEPGHEGWGVVDAVGEAVTTCAPGDRVALLSSRAFATHDIAPETHVVRLPSALARLPFPAEPLGCAMNIIRRSTLAAGQTIAIVGIGFLGALLTQLATAAGARVIAVSRRAYALEMAQMCGAHAVVRLDDDLWQTAAAVRAIAGEDGCVRVIEAAGKQHTLDLAAELVATRGTLVIAGYHQDGRRTVNMQSWNWRGIDVVNAHERDAQVYVDGMRHAVEAVVAGTLQPLALFTHTLPLSELGTALRLTDARPDGFMKALVVP